MMILMTVVAVAGFASVALFSVNLFREEDQLEQQAH